MPQTNELLFAFEFFTALMGFTVMGILLFVNKSRSLAPKLLAAYVFCFSITILHICLSYTLFYLRFPYLWRSTAWTTFCAPAISYLYVRTVLYQSFRLKKTDWLLFLPAVLYSMTLLPYYLKSNAEKLQVVNQFMVNKSLIAKEPEGMLPQGWGIILRCALGLILLTGQFVMLAKMKPRIFQADDPARQNHTTYQWLFLFTSILFVFYSVLSVEHIFHFKQRTDLSALIFITMTGTIFFITFYLLMRPNILYGFKGWLHVHTETPKAIEKPVAYMVAEEEKKPYLTTEQGRTYKILVEKHFAEKKPFLKPGYKIGDLTEELDIPLYQLSAFINQEYGKNFNELVNGYRIAYVGNLLKTSPEHSLFTLEAIAKEAGFNSRTNFFTAVKKQTGKNPSEYFGTRESIVAA